MNGIDWSEWDNTRHPGIDVRDFFAGFDYVIVRTHNENGGNDRFVTGNVEAAKTCGKPWGLYAWPIVGRGLDGNRAHAASIIDSYGVPPIGLWADSEHSGRGFASPDEVLGFILGASDRGALGGYYCAINELYRSPALDRAPWWVADYGPNDGNYHDPNEQWPFPPADRPWVIHQFTSVGWPGGGPLDVNYAPNLDFAGAPSAPEQPASREDDMHLLHNPDDDTWVLVQGFEMQYPMDKGLVWDLAVANVPHGEIPGHSFPTLAQSLAAMSDRQVAKVVAAMPPSGGGGTTPVPPDQWSDADVVDQFNKRLKSGAIDTSVIAQDV